LLVKESLKLLRPTIPSWIELKVQIDASASPVLADPTQMHQMIINLVDNALHAMRKTVGILEVQLQGKEILTDQITPSGRLATGSYVCLTVRNSGEGMEPEVVGRIVDPFFTIKPLGDGRGMGLSVIQEIVAIHGGTVVAESQIGVGTAVSVYLPALPPRATSVPATNEPLPRGYDECILFVDDEESLARSGGKMLVSLGYYPVVRTSATAAWEAFQLAPQRFDLLIADQTMPDMTGDRLADRCRRLRSDLPVILCADSEQKLSDDEARLPGITEFVPKPLTLHDLAHRIRRVLDARPTACPSSPDQPIQVQERVLLSLEGSDAVSSRR
jgi:CheY-like chemotaxis protein